MAYLMEIPVEGGGVLRIQGSEEDAPSGLELAARRRGSAGQLIVRADETIQAALDSLKPALAATMTRLRELAADEVTVEFGLVLGVEGGAIIAKGTAETHFTVTLAWKRPENGPGAATEPESVTGGRRATPAVEKEAGPDA